MAAPGIGIADPVGRCSVSMLDSFPVLIIVGTALGFLSGIGVGGGSLLILWLTAVIQMDYFQARFINLLFFLPSAIITSCTRWRQGLLSPVKVLPGVLAGCLGAIAGCWISGRIDTEILQKIFGGLLLLTGIRELLYKPKQKREQ